MSFTHNLRHQTILWHNVITFLITVIKFVFFLNLLPDYIPAKVLYLSVYHVVIGLFLWAYYATAMTTPAQPPSQVTGRIWSI